MISPVTTGSEYLAGMVTNVLGAGWREQTPITGSSCKDDDDDDFFVLTEQMDEGDTLTVSIADPHHNLEPTSGKFRMRVYFDRPCPFSDDGFANQQCNVAHQLWPPVPKDGKNNELICPPANPTDNDSCADYYSGTQTIEDSTPGTHLVFVGVHGLLCGALADYALQAHVEPPKTP